MTLIIWLLRICGSLLDGWNGRRIGWWPFHVVNWLRRDVPIVILYWHQLGAPWLAAADWFAVAILHTVAHWVLYLTGEKMKERRYAWR